MCSSMLWKINFIVWVYCVPSALWLSRNAPAIIIVDITEAQYTVTCIEEAESEKRKKQDSLDEETGSR